MGIFRHYWTLTFLFAAVILAYYQKNGVVQMMEASSVKYGNDSVLPTQGPGPSPSLVEGVSTTHSSIPSPTTITKPRNPFLREKSKNDEPRFSFPTIHINFGVLKYLSPLPPIRYTLNLIVSILSPPLAPLWLLATTCWDLLVTKPTRLMWEVMMSWLYPIYMFVGSACVFGCVVGGVAGLLHRAFVGATSEASDSVPKKGSRKSITSGGQHGMMAPNTRLRVADSDRRLPKGRDEPIEKWRMESW